MAAPLGVGEKKVEGSKNYFSHSVIPAKAGRWIHTEVRQLLDEDLSPAVEVQEWDRTIRASENRLICCHGGVGARMSDSTLKAAFVGIHRYAAEGPILLQKYSWHPNAHF